MTTTHTTRARQRNDRDLAANADRIETMDAKIAALKDELADLHAERRALTAMAEALR